MTDEKTQTMRLDKWLWAARFYKTRSLASSEIQKGRVTLNEQRVKPARLLHVGDQVLVQKHPYRFEIEVLALSDKRGPAVQAQRLYHESEASELARKETAQKLRAERHIISGLRGEGRPSKRQRRQIIRFRHNSERSSDGDEPIDKSGDD